MEIRPYGGSGLGMYSVSSGGLSNSSSKVAFWPGVTALFPLNNFFVGGDARYSIITGVDGPDSANAFSMFVTGGMHF